MWDESVNHLKTNIPSFRQLKHPPHSVLRKNKKSPSLLKGF